MQFHHGARPGIKTLPDTRSTVSVSRVVLQRNAVSCTRVLSSQLYWVPWMIDCWAVLSYHDLSK